MGWCTRGEAASCHITSSQPPNTFLPTVNSAFVPQPAVVFPQSILLYFLKVHHCISSKPVVVFPQSPLLYLSQLFLCDSLRNSVCVFLPFCFQLIYEEEADSYSFASVFGFQMARTFMRWENKTNRDTFLFPKQLWIMLKLEGAKLIICQSISKADADICEMERGPN